jgi:hypothetical protein
LLCREGLPCGEVFNIYGPLATPKIVYIRIHAVARMNRQTRDDSLCSREDFPPCIVMGGTVVVVLFCTGLNQTAVVESIDTNPR